MIVGIIDTGIDQNHCVFENAKLSGFTLYKEEDGTISKKHNAFPDKKGHGTGIVSIILQFTPEVEFIVVKLDSFSGKNTEDLLVEAISSLVEYSSVKVINISMGVRSSDPSEEIKKVCAKAMQKDIPIIAATCFNHEKHEECYPAHLESVYSVGVGLVNDKNRFRYLDHNCILAKGHYSQVATPGDNFWVADGTSFAAASFTGIIAKAYLGEYWQCHKTLKNWLKLNTDNSVKEAI